MKTREYAWYCIELDAIVFQVIMEDCHIAFWWDHWDLYEASKFIDIENDEPMDCFSFFPLGEL